MIRSRTIPFLGHPRAVLLDRFARGELDAPRRARVASHLERCADCRSAVTFTRRLAETARQAPWPEASSQTLERILARRAAGERVILPVAPPTRKDRSRWRINALVAAAVLAAVAAVTLRTSDVVAGATEGELHFEPAMPKRGARVAVEYRAPASLAGEDRLVLRASFRTPKDVAYSAGTTRLVVAELRRRGDGRYNGAFTLPDSVVHGLFAVEDREARRVDHNGHKFWHLLTVGPGGRPSADALEQKMNAAMGRSWEEAYQTARQMATLYPQSVVSWNTLFFYEGAVLGEPALDSLRRQHRARLLEFDRRLSAAPGLTGDDLGQIMWYARSVGDSTVETRWRTRLLREAGSHPLAVQERAIDIMQRHGSDVTAAIREYDELWNEVGPAHATFTSMGWRAALQSKDPDAIRRWSSHYLARRPYDSSYVAVDLATIPRLREEGPARLRSLLHGARQPSDAERRLAETRSEFAARTRLRVGRLLGDLGTALVSGGNRAAGADTLELAADIGWRPEFAREAAEARLTLGDTTRALRLLARLAVDPATPDSVLRGVRALASAHADSARWVAWLDTAAVTMRERVLEEGTMKQLRGAIRLMDVAGRETTLGALAGGRPTVVVFWSRYCGPAIEEIPRLERFAANLRGRNVPLVVVSEDSLTAEVQSFTRAKGGTFRLYHDRWRETQKAFSNFGTPTYFVLDENARIRFEHTSLDEIPRQLQAISPQVAALRTGS